MTPKVKSILRKIIYFLLFALMIVAFIVLSEKYADNSEQRISVISDYYENTKANCYEVISGNKMISLLKSGKNIIFIGSSVSDYSIKYMEELDAIFKNLKIDKVYYYDINNDKSQENSNYYDIKELLNGYLVETDTISNNLLSPSLYIVNDGKVMYYNVETSAMKNTDTVKSYWTPEKEITFSNEITAAISNYYLN